MRSTLPTVSGTAESWNRRRACLVQEIQLRLTAHERGESVSSTGLQSGSGRLQANELQGLQGAGKSLDSNRPERPDLDKTQSESVCRSCQADSLASVARPDGGIYLLYVLGYNISGRGVGRLRRLFGTAVHTAVVMVIYLEEAAARTQRPPDTVSVSDVWSAERSRGDRPCT